MSQFNLIPNPLIVGIQFVFFIIALVIVRSFFLKPYLLLKEKRKSLTEGAKNEGEALLESNQKISAKIEEEMNKALLSAKQTSKEIRETSAKQAEEEIMSAEKKMHEELISVQNKAKTNLEEAKQDILSSADNLSKEVYLKILS